MPTRWTRERCIELIALDARTGGRAPTRQQYTDDPERPHPKTLHNLFGSWGNAMRAAGVEPNASGAAGYDSQALAERTKAETRMRVAHALAERPDASYGEIAAMTGHHLHTVRSYGAELEDERTIRRRVAESTFGHAHPFVTDEEMMDDLRQCAGHLGRTPGTSAFDAWFGWARSRLYIFRFGSWTRACERAGLTPNVQPEGMGLRHYTDHELLAPLAAMLAERGYVTATEYDRDRSEGTPSSGTIRMRFGRWGECVARAENGVAECA